jgi:hypothetical protein
MREGLGKRLAHLCIMACLSRSAAEFRSWCAMVGPAMEGRLLVGVLLVKLTVSRLAGVVVPEDEVDDT